jgi:hypothetical protein
MTFFSLLFSFISFFIIKFSLLVSLLYSNNLIASAISSNPLSFSHCKFLFKMQDINKKRLKYLKSIKRQSNRISWKNISTQRENYFYIKILIKNTINWKWSFLTRNKWKNTKFSDVFCLFVWTSKSKVPKNLNFLLNCQMIWHSRFELEHLLEKNFCLSFLLKSISKIPRRYDKNFGLQQFVFENNDICIILFEYSNAKNSFKLKSFKNHWKKCLRENLAKRHIFFICSWIEEK